MEACSLLGKLDRENLSLIILSGSRIIHSSGASGIRPLVEVIDMLGREILKGSIVVDKIIGKASALLISYFRAKEAIGKVVSSSRVRVLDLYGVKYFADTLVSEIRNRSGTDVCPFEKIVLEVERPADAFRLVKQQLNKDAL